MKQMFLCTQITTVNSGRTVVKVLLLYIYNLINMIMPNYKKTLVDQVNTPPVTKSLLFQHFGATNGQLLGLLRSLVLGLDGQM